MVSMAISLNQRSEAFQAYGHATLRDGSASRTDIAAKDAILTGCKITEVVFVDGPRRVVGVVQRQGGLIARARQVYFERQTSARRVRSLPKHNLPFGKRVRSA